MVREPDGGIRALLQHGYAGCDPTSNLGSEFDAIGLPHIGDYFRRAEALLPPGFDHIHHKLVHALGRSKLAQVAAMTRKVRAADAEIATALLRYMEGLPSLQLSPQSEAALFQLAEEMWPLKSFEPQERLS